MTNEIRKLRGRLVYHPELGISGRVLEYAWTRGGESVRMLVETTDGELHIWSPSSVTTRHESLPANQISKAWIGLLELTSTLIDKWDAGQKVGSMIPKLRGVTDHIRKELG